MLLLSITDSDLNTKKWKETGSAIKQTTIKIILFKYDLIQRGKIN